MENLEAVEQRVWQRIRGQADTAPLQALATAERSAATTYLMLSQMVNGHARAMLRQMYQQERRHERCLCGMRMLHDGHALMIRTVPPQIGNVTAALRKCYADSLRRAEQYEQHSHDDPYGAAFSLLGHQEREHCVMLLEICGSLPG